MAQAEAQENVKNDREVIVVGASAAGLFTATSVARGGRRVRVLESKPQFEPAPRTLIVTDHFRQQMGASARSSIVNEIRRSGRYLERAQGRVVRSYVDLACHSIERSRQSGFATKSGDLSCLPTGARRKSHLPSPISSLSARA